MRIINKVKKLGRRSLRKGRRAGSMFKNSLCYRYYYKDKLDENVAVFTSKNGEDIAGNMFRLMLELNEQRKDIKIVIPATKQKEAYIRSVLNANGLNSVKIIRYDSVNYFKYLETSKYLFCDSTLPYRFIKRKGQVYVNTWHGTPLKMMGNDSKSDRFAIGNVQKNFMSSEYLVYPNDYCMQKMTEAYSIDKIYSGNIFFAGYPRNDIFYNEEKRKETRKKYNIDDKKVYIYMPTYREVSGVKQNDMLVKQLETYLADIDKTIKDDEVFYVKLHVFVETTIDFSKFKNIRKFPGSIETYEFLNTADCLISDYSSVMFDYANARRKIIRFVYDEEDYFRTRGFYDLPVEMPFPKVYTTDELISEMRKGMTYDDAPFYEEYCKYEEGDAAKKIISRVFNESAESDSSDGKVGRVYIYNESFRKGIINDLLDDIIEKKYKDEKVYLSFSKESMRKKVANYDNVSENSEGTLGVSVAMDKTFSEVLAYKLFYTLGWDTHFTRRQLDRLYMREADRLFSGYKFDEFIYYQGYNVNLAEVIAAVDSKSTIYIFYNYMFKKNKKELRRLLSKYDEIVVCDEEMKPYLEKIVKKDISDKIKVNEYYNL